MGGQLPEPGQESRSAVTAGVGVTTARSPACGLSRASPQTKPRVKMQPAGVLASRGLALGVKSLPCRWVEATPV